MAARTSKKKTYVSCTPKIKTHLGAKDPKMAAWIEEVGVIRREISGNLFEDILRSIVSQQIAGAVAEAIWGRLRALWGGKPPTPKRVLAAEIEDLRRCGLSLRKAEYVRGIAEAALENRVDFKNMYRMEDAEVIRQLSSLRGVGEWTAQMFLLFSLGRPDILSFGDYGIRKGLMLLYGKKEITAKDFERYRRRYSPHGSVASFYLWARADEG